MRKILLTTLTLASVASLAVAADYAPFQEFDNQYNAGYSFSQYQLSNGGGQQALQQNQGLDIQIERLFDVGVWMDLDANYVIATNSLGNKSTGTGMGGVQPASQVPNLGGVNGKVGYSFAAVPSHLLITPYALLGYNTNIAMSTITSNNFANVTGDSYMTAGVGGRIEYRITKWVDIYADQNAVYNWDQSAPLNGIMPQNNMIYTTTVGAKFKPYKNLILGVNGFYNNYQYMAAAPGSGSTNGGNSSTGGTYSIYQPQNNFGGMVTVGLTY